MNRLLFWIYFLFIQSACQYQDSNIDTGGRYLDVIYFSDSTISSKVSFLDGMKDGLGEWFYEGGGIKVRAHFEKGLQIGETKYYYPDGAMRSYVFYDDLGGAIFKIDYDEAGNVLSERGIPFSIQFKGDTIIDRNDVFSFYIKSATPPNCEVALLIGRKNEDQALSIEQTYLVKKGRIPYLEFEFDDLGKNEVFIISELKDTVQGLFKIDTVSFSVFVRE